MRAQRPREQREQFREERRERLGLLGLFSFFFREGRRFLYLVRNEPISALAWRGAAELVAELEASPEAWGFLLFFFRRMLCFFWLETPRRLLFRHRFLALTSTTPLGELPESSSNMFWSVVRVFFWRRIVGGRGEEGQGDERRGREGVDVSN